MSILFLFAFLPLITADPCLGTYQAETAQLIRDFHNWRFDFDPMLSYLERTLGIDGTSDNISSLVPISHCIQTQPVGIQPTMVVKGARAHYSATIREKNNLISLVDETEIAMSNFNRIAARLLLMKQVIDAKC